MIDRKALRMAVRVAKMVQEDVMRKVNHINSAISSRMNEESEGKYGGGSAATTNFPRKSLNRLSKSRGFVSSSSR